MVENIQNNKEHFLIFGHGKGSSPEIHHREPKFLLSAGGASRGLLSRIIVRPTVIVFSGEKDDIKENLHLPGRNIYSNNTCVHKNFACSDAPVYVPDHFELLLDRMGWEIYLTPTDFLLAVHNRNDLGIAVLFPELNKDDVLSLFYDIKTNNLKNSDLYKVFRWSNGKTIEYNTRSPGGYWAIKSVNGIPTDRDFDRWPLFNYKYGPQKPH